MQRLRVTFSKGGAFRYTSNLDLQKSLDRLFRRANLPVAYSQGFHPQPKMNIAAPLPLGWQGEQELFEVWLSESREPNALHQDLSHNAPSGIEIMCVQEIDLNSPAIQSLVLSLDYAVTVPGEFDAVGVQAKIDQILASPSLPRTRRGKRYDLRPLIINIDQQIAQAAGVPVIHMLLGANQDATGRPDEVLDEMGFDPFLARISRTRINLKQDEPG